MKAPEEVSIPITRTIHYCRRSFFLAIPCISNLLESFLLAPHSSISRTRALATRSASELSSVTKKGVVEVTIFSSVTTSLGFVLPPFWVVDVLLDSLLTPTSQIGGIVVTEQAGEDARRLAFSYRSLP
jgi:hypothetical protein